MKNKEPQPSEALAKHFAPYREETPLLSAPEIEKLLARRDMLPNNHPPPPALERRGSLFNIRRIIMTLSGITGLGLAAYFAFFAHGNNSTNGTKTILSSLKPLPSLVAPPKTTLPHTAPLALTSSAQLRSTGNDRGPWSAGNDQIYADLTREELAKLGISLTGDTINTYALDDKDSLEKARLTYHYVQSYGSIKTLPPGIEAHHIFPELITFGNGNGAAWQTPNGGCGMIPKEINSMLLPWLNKPGIPGLHAIGFENHVEKEHGVTYDTIRLDIGKDFATPAPFPFQWPFSPREYPDSVKNTMMQLGYYYEGTASKPISTLPKNLVLVVDTITPNDVLNQLAEQQNSGIMEHIRSIVSRLNELIPVIVRPHGGSGAPDTSDFILWYEPSQELFNALPPAQAAAFRHKLAEPPQCMNAPEAVSTHAEVTYCVSEPQQVNVRVFDLMGHIVLSETQHAEAGDNIAKINTEKLSSGMYIILVQDNDGGQRTRRIWVQNANPK